MTTFKFRSGPNTQIVEWTTPDGRDAQIVRFQGQSGKTYLEIYLAEKPGEVVLFRTYMKTPADIDALGLSDSDLIEVLRGCIEHEYHFAPGVEGLLGLTW